ncbi:hypothetical protein M427DRAFT_295102 [Gonapodya prolifera JEL478]|uniref:Uncharacterized protein n=1 Tax=Gonapodya prolifera (strain JEL478) TaxID=1344416 RepID=A0A139AHE4_GONPJ|nr:hypothetical protein M427DRAFT_295102 [Gonapodya prolifera JEL478]|eukprot:KXS16241.1 hypothetical protein M427DRAFT_295102 [Gonapodya prolifera JEL478]
MLMVGTLAVKLAPIYSFAAVPLITITLVFWEYCRSAYKRRSEFLPFDKLRCEVPPDFVSESNSERGDGLENAEVGSASVVTLRKRSGWIFSRPGGSSADNSAQSLNDVRTSSSGGGPRAMPRDLDGNGFFCENPRDVRAFTGDSGVIGVDHWTHYHVWLPRDLVASLPPSDPLSLFATYAQRAPLGIHIVNGGENVSYVPRTSISVDQPRLSTSRDPAASPVEAR